MITTNEFKSGSAFEMDGQLITIVNVEHIKLARGSAVIKAKLRNIRTGSIFEQSFRSGDKFKVVRIESTEATYLYSDGDLYHFMDTETYEQVALNGSMLADALPFLKEGNPVRILRYEDQLIGVELPINVELTVTATEPGVRGDTVSAMTKPAQLETGATIQVPPFVNEGDVVRVDTRNGSYMERV
ncbi:MAG TPA: elongation factor P [Candidatus Dormibacteraeota bacterium]